MTQRSKAGEWGDAWGNFVARTIFEVPCSTRSLEFKLFIIASLLQYVWKFLKLCECLSFLWVADVVLLKSFCWNLFAAELAILLLAERIALVDLFIWFSFLFYAIWGKFCYSMKSMLRFKYCVIILYEIVIVILLWFLKRSVNIWSDDSIIYAEFSCPICHVWTVDWFGIFSVFWISQLLCFLPSFNFCDLIDSVCNSAFCSPVRIDFGIVLAVEDVSLLCEVRAFLVASEFWLHVRSRNPFLICNLETFHKICRFRAPAMFLSSPFLRKLVELWHKMTKRVAASLHL